MLSQCRVPKHFGGSLHGSKCTWHVLCDANQTAYAACIFVRIETADGVHIRLVQSRACIAPIKTATIPRLELLAAVIGVRLFKAVQEAFQLQDPCIYYWTDSRVVLHWTREAGPFPCFVANRSKEINTLSCSENWRYIPCVLNPDDLPSRGASAKTIIEQKWWEGPTWLQLEPDMWPSEDLLVESISTKAVNPEKAIVVTSQQNVSTDPALIDKICLYFSSYTRTVRMVAWKLRFAHNTRNSHHKLVGQLSMEEIDEAEACIPQLIQQDSLLTSQTLASSKLVTLTNGKGLTCVSPG